MNGPSNLTGEQHTQIDFANYQIERLNEQVETLYQNLETVDERLDEMGDDENTEALTDERTVTMDQINYATYTIAEFSVSVSNLQQRTNSIEVVETCAGAIWICAP